LNPEKFIGAVAGWASLLVSQPPTAIAMARTNAPDSATSQFFINHVNNDALNYGVQGAGYTVFGKVVEGMDVVDKIAAVPTNPGDVPVETVLIKSIRVE